MANTITFSSTRGSLSVTVTPVPGSLRLGGGHDDRGGGTIPSARAGYARNGSCEVVMTSTTATGMQQTLAQLLSLVSPVGEGDIDVTGAGTCANVNAYGCIVDVTVGGDSVQTATISWKGSYNPTAASA